MKRTAILSMIVAAVVMVFVPWAATAEPASQTYPNYSVFKGGYYYPSERIRLDEFSDTDFDRKKGFNGEVAFGHYYGPVIGTEFGVGYFSTRRFPGVGPGRSRIDAMPVLLSLKVILPIGPVEPYAEAGVGAYFTRLELESDTVAERRFREVDFGPHAGVGMNINFTDTMYLGVEGRYRKVKPDYDGREVRLDGYTATLNLGFRYK